MIFAIFFSLTLIIGISFAVTRRTLHIFEIIFIWMIVIVIYYNFINIAAVNLHLFKFTDRLPNYWALVFERSVLVPLVILFYYDQMVARRPYQKWVWLPFVLLLLTGLEYMTQRLGLYSSVRWKCWWSTIEWLVLVLLIHYSWLGYRSLLRKEMK